MGRNIQALVWWPCTVICWKMPRKSMGFNSKAEESNAGISQLSLNTDGWETVACTRSRGTEFMPQSVSSVAYSCPTLCDPMNSSTPGLPVHYQLLEFTQIHVHRVSDAIQPSHPLSSPSPPAPNPSQHQGFSPMSQLFTWGGQSIGFSALASILPKNTQGWSLLMDWLELHEVQRTLKNLLQHHSSKASILQCLAFFTIQLSHPYMTTGKTIALTRWTFVGKVVSLLFNMLCMLVITFLPRSKCLLISWLQSQSALTLEP